MTARNLDVAAVGSTPEHTRAVWELAELLATGYIRLLAARPQSTPVPCPACRPQKGLDSQAQQRDELDVVNTRR